MARDNVILPHRIYKSMRNMSDAECGRLFRALLLHSMGESQQIKLQGREVGLFDVYSQDIDDDIAAYEAKCARNRVNGTQSGPVAPSGGQSGPVGASGTQSPHNNNNNNNNKDINKDINNHHDDDARASLHTVEAYASGNLQYLSPGNMEELGKFKADLPDDVIRFAIDEACGNGAPRWAYVSAILRGYLRDGVKTVGDAKAAKEKRKGRTAPDKSTRGNQALEYEQRDNSTYEDFEFFDPTKEAR